MGECSMTWLNGNVTLDQELIDAFFGVPTDKEIDEALIEAEYDLEEVGEGIREFVSKCLQGVIQ